MDKPPKTRNPAVLNDETSQMVGISWFGGPLTDLSRVGVPFFWFLVLGCVCIFIFGGVGHDLASGAREIARWLVAAGGILASGVATGFLFAVPRTLQREEAAQAPRSDGGDYSVDKQSDQVGPSRLSPVRIVARYTVNSNLEQISDWLTKIIVGVGLTQLHNLPWLASRAAAFLAGGVDSNSRERAFALGLILYFGVVGFIEGYVLTRVYVTGAFVRADIDNDRMS